MTRRWPWLAMGAAAVIAAGAIWLTRFEEHPAPPIFEDWAIKLTSAPLRVADVEAVFAQVRYDFIQVRDGRGPVPRILVGAVPEDLGQVAEVRRRKALFLGALLPLVMAVNEQIASERAVIERAARERALGQQPAARDAAEVNRLARVYRLIAADATVADVGAPDFVDELLLRVAPLPVSMALAQAAEESAWGLSRFADEGNALFGQWVWNDPTGITPLARAPGETHSIKSFRDLLECTLSYAHNLNTHAAYGDFRRMRANMMSSTGVLDGHALAATLNRYSGRGQAYVESLRGIIRANSLGPLDIAKFATRRSVTRVAAVGSGIDVGS